MARAHILLVLIVAGCGATYERLDTEALARRHPWAAVAHRGCLDLGVHLTRHPSVPGRFTVVRYELGNRCDRPLRLDLSAVRARARYADGVELTLARHDPRREVVPATLEHRSRAVEVLAYAPAIPRDGAPAVVCLTLDGVLRDASAATTPWTQCLTVPPEGDLPVAPGGSS